MAMSGIGMAADCFQLLSNVEPAVVNDPIKTLENLQAITTGIVTHIQLNARVSPGIAVSTTGSPAAQTGFTTTAGFIV